MTAGRHAAGRRSPGSAILPALLLLLAACTTLPETTPATGTVGGQQVAAGVDSPEAAYFMGRYLAGERGWSEVDARIDALYAAAVPGALPDSAELKRIADAFSVDFAAIYFAERVADVAANRLLRRTYDAQLERALADYRRAAPPRLLPEAADYTFIGVPGYYYESHRESGADLAEPRGALEDAGLQPQLILTDEAGAVEANADLVTAALRRAARPDRKIIVVSASKSGPEVALALSRLAPREARTIKAWINIVGLLRGTPLADEILGDGPLSRYRSFVEDDGLHSLVTGKRRDAFRRFRLRDGLLVVNYIGIPVTGTISERARDSYIALRAYGPNDGLNLLADQIAPGSVTLADFGRDHYLAGDTLRPRTIALVNTTVAWLTRCAAPAGPPPSDPGATADCGWAARQAP